MRSELNAKVSGLAAPDRDELYNRTDDDCLGRRGNGRGEAVVRKLRDAWFPISLRQY